MLSHSSLTIPSLHCTVGLYLCVRFFLCSQNKFVSRPEPLRCRAVRFIRGDIMLLFLVRSCSLVLHSAGLGFSPPGFMVCSRQSVRSTMSAASHTKKRTHLQTHTHRKQSISPEIQPTLQVLGTLKHPHSQNTSTFLKKDNQC